MKPEKLKIILTSALFALLLISAPILFFLTPDLVVSRAERRKLQQAPVLSVNAVLSGTVQKNWDAYTLDQFPFRDTARTLKALCNYDLLGRLDNNGLYRHENYLCKLDGPLEEAQITAAANKLNSLRDTLFPDSECWYAIVPDKNTYAGKSIGYPVLDYEQAAGLMRDTVRDMEYIDLSAALSLEDYYRTDTHWKQENLEPVVNALCAAMDLKVPNLSGFKQTQMNGFLGVYAGQSALPAESEALRYLSDSFTQSATVLDAEAQQAMAVYQPEKFSGTDPYDVYLGGAKALLEIDTGADTGRELLLFRDSFGSSLAPLLFSRYDKITLIDLRYIATQKLTDYVNFSGQDVLFLYSTGVLNNSAMLR